MWVALGAGCHWLMVLVHAHGVMVTIHGCLWLVTVLCMVAVALRVVVGHSWVVGMGTPHCLYLFGVKGAAVVGNQCGGGGWSCHWCHGGLGWSVMWHCHVWGWVCCCCE